MGNLNIRQVTPRNTPSIINTVLVDFYARGGDFPVEINSVPLTPADRADLVAFLKSLSDDRARFERAPFDHPEICIPTGYPDVPSADPAFPLSAVDRWAGIPAVGRNGNPVPLANMSGRKMENEVMMLRIPESSRDGCGFGAAPSHYSHFKAVTGLMRTERNAGMQVDKAAQTVSRTITLPITSGSSGLM